MDERRGVSCSRLQRKKKKIKGRTGQGDQPSWLARHKAGLLRQVGLPGAKTTTQLSTQAQGRGPGPVPERTGGLSQFKTTTGWNFPREEKRRGHIWVLRLQALPRCLAPKGLPTCHKPAMAFPALDVTCVLLVGARETLADELHLISWQLSPQLQGCICK